jgi:putative flippase GtrA
MNSDSKPLERGLDKLLANGLKARLKRAVSQFWKYCVVGATGYLVNFAIFTVLYGVVGVSYLLAATVSFAVSATNNFLLNKYWTFGNPAGNTATQAGRFLVVSVASWSLNMALLILMVEALGINEYVSQALAIATVTILNFTGNKLWSFRQPRS